MQGPGVEVPIPILKDSLDKIPSPTVDALNRHAHSQSGSSKTPDLVPTISVTKPPAPLPVVLPLPHEIIPLPSPPGSAHSSMDEDLESGRINGMRDVSEDIGLVTSTRRTGKSKSPARRETSDASGSALPLSPPLPELLPSTRPIATKSSSPAPIIPDLLEDSTPGLIQAPLEPSLSQIITDSLSSSPPNLIVDASSSGIDEDEVPNTTIRLIGGGGQAGISQGPTELLQEEDPQPHVANDSELVPMVPATPVDAGTKKGDKVHKKSKSNLALKRISQLGGLRKKDSASSMKEVVSPSTT
jgi:hypothetical protein